MAAEPSGRPSARAWLVLGAKVVLSVALFAVLLVKLDIHWTGLRATLRSADPAGLGAALGLMLASNVLGAWQWGRLLRAVGISSTFRAVGTDPNNPRRFSHVYVAAQVPGGPVAMDTTYGSNALGWEPSRSRFLETPA